MNLREKTIALAWLIEGEGCIAFLRRWDYKPNPFMVRCDIKIAMADRGIIEEAYETICQLVGDDDGVGFYEERRKIRRRLPLWRVEVNSKSGSLAVLEAIEPFMSRRGMKWMQVQLALNYLRRAASQRWYRQTAADARLADIATDLRHYRGEAYIEAVRILGLDMVIPSQAPVGLRYEDADGSGEGVTTSGPSPNGNGHHERPASSSRKRTDGDIV